MKYEVIIGLEIHLELQTRSKLFCGCSTAFGDKPNVNCCPICLGLPGSLPVFNGKAIELALRAALALNSAVQERSRFDRKNYFYPDLPKAYQVSQYQYPLARGGYLPVCFNHEEGHIMLERVHLEEEAGKLVHGGDSILGSAYSLVDYNRAGIPLLEIVTAPELRSGTEARLFLEELRTLLLYTGVSDCKMEEGSLRCDANISLRREGERQLGVKTEVKNVNSFRSVEAALDYEAERQRRILDGGGTIIQETRHWDEENKATSALRSKEGSADYRYFPEPDLLPLVLDPAFVDSIAANLPELPRQRRERLVRQFGLEPSAAAFLTNQAELGEIFERAAESYADYENLSHWVRGDLLYLLRDQGVAPVNFNPDLLAELLNLLDEGVISRPVAKELLAEVVDGGGSPRDLVASKGLARISEYHELEPIIDEVLAKNPEAVDNYHRGKKKALAFLVGQIMALTRGRADPAAVNLLLKDKLKS